MRLARGCGVPLLGVFSLALVLFLVSYYFLPTLGFGIAMMLILTLSTLALIFFRDPERKIGEGIISPADGKISKIDVNDRGARISIFMNIHNVHVNRSPIDGKVVSTTHHQGGHVPAFNKDSDRNERYHTVILGEKRVEVIQIAGAFARRIVPYVSEGDTMDKGDRMGMIRFGSRVDVYLPPGVKPSVKLGDRVLAGSTTIAEEDKP